MLLSETVVITTRHERGPVTSACDWLGTVLAVHRIGPYALVEYQSSRPGNAEPGWQSERRFSGFVIDPSSKRKDANGWTNTSRSSASLEAGIVDCIAYAADGCNTQASRFFMKMIAEEPKKS